MTNGKARVLVIDDHPPMAYATKLMIEDIDGFEVVAEAVDGQTGIANALELLPDIVVVDYRLKDMAGTDVCKSIRDALGDRVRCIIYTGEDYSVIEGKIAVSGVTAVIGKQLDAEVFVFQMRLALQGLSIVPTTEYHKSLRSLPQASEPGGRWADPTRGEYVRRR